jgi:hypothetical protein
MAAQGITATLVAATLAISRSSLYYRKKARGSRADRSYDEQIVVACGKKPAYGYRRVAWWLGRKEGLRVNRKRVLRVMRERGLLVHSRRLRARRKKQWGRVVPLKPANSCSGREVRESINRKHSGRGLSPGKAGRKSQPNTREDRLRACTHGFRNTQEGAIGARTKGRGARRAGRHRANNAS